MPGSDSRNTDTTQIQAHQPGTRQVHQPDTSASVGAAKPDGHHEAVASQTAPPQAVGTSSSEQATEEQDAVRAE